MEACDTIEEIEEVLRGLRGVREVRRFDGAARARIAEIEREYNESSVLPIRNLGITAVIERERTYVLLKDGVFRQPPCPTVYMVEEPGHGAADLHVADESGAADGPVRSAADGTPGAGGPMLMVDGVSYRVIGEEIIGTGAASNLAVGEEAIFLSDSFALYPRRRVSSHVPSFFVLPPLPFQELEAERSRLGITNIFSISPSIAVDIWLREALGFPPTNELATLLVGFDSIS